MDFNSDFKRLIWIHCEIVGRFTVSVLSETVFIAITPIPHPNTKSGPDDRGADGRKFFRLNIAENH